MSIRAWYHGFADECLAMAPAREPSRVHPAVPSTLSPKRCRYRCWSNKIFEMKTSAAVSVMVPADEIVLEKRLGFAQLLLLLLAVLVFTTSRARGSDDTL
ncbi:hypothetical protein C8R45DRAFT_1087900 [Mycena sanguinolenta]|nr:hypothetical protein C8R45DRAFT_1087900 [Mycena sanguinolenta]